ncbi:unnamed protein product [Calypogeia fissa]
MSEAVNAEETMLCLYLEYLKSVCWTHTETDQFSVWRSNTALTFYFRVDLSSLHVDVAWSRVLLLCKMWAVGAIDVR